MSHPEDARGQTRRRARAVALVLVAYGAIGLVLMVVIAIGISRPLDDIAALTKSLETQRLALVQSMESTTATVSEAAGTTSNFRDSLDRAGRSATTAANLSRSVSGTMTQIAVAMQVQVFSTQPFISLAEPFNEAGRELTGLGTELDGVSGALVSNRDSVVRIGDRLTELSTRVRDLTTSVRDGPRVEVSAGALGSARLVLYAVLAWLALLAVGCIVAGAALWSRLR